jgi:hypothetical protein
MFQPQEDTQDQSTINTASLSEAAPQPRSFATFITQLEDGRLHHDISAQMQELAEHLTIHAHTYGGKSRGKINLTLELATDDEGFFEIRAEVKVTKPKMTRSRSIMWTDAANNLVPHNPRQMDMFAVRDVTRGTAQSTKQL